MITSFGNPNIRNLVQLNQKAKARREQKVFVAEGLKMFLEAPASQIREVYISESFVMREEAEKKLALLRHGDIEGESGTPGSHGARIETVSREVFAKISDTITPQGILCVVGQSFYRKEELFGINRPLWVILEDLQDPGNVGTILRTGEAAGITGVILTKNCVDLYNPKTIRATMGSVYRVPFFYTDDLPDIIRELQRRKTAVYAAHLGGTAWYDEPDYSTGTAFLIGNEGNGLRPETARLADSYLKIPMQGQVESLNAAAAAAVLMYEAARQRRT